MKFALFLVPVSLIAADAPWPAHGGVDNIRYSPLKQITPKNVGQLQLAWRHDTHDEFKGSEMQANPVVVDGVLYTTTPKLRVVALDAATGKELWSFNPHGGPPPERKNRSRGVTVHQDRVFVTSANWLWAVDRKSGRPVQSFGDNGRVDLRVGLDRPLEQTGVSASTPGAVFEDLFILGTAVSEGLPGTPGHIQAYDVKTGKRRWIFHTIPHPGEFGYDTWPKEAYKLNGGANAWAGVVVDPKLAMVFAATGSASFDFYGSNRHGDNLFANCVLALDARTGERVWHFQAIKHDVWDYDFPAAPNLVTVTRNGRKIPALSQITKYGFVYLFDRKTGEPLFPIELRKVSPSPVEGEKLSEVQPYPVKPPPYARQRLTEDMLRDIPEVRERFRKVKSEGMWTPPTTEGTIIFPGFDGGGEWGGPAFDPETGLLYVNSNEMAWILRLIPRDRRSNYLANCASCHRDDRTGTPPEFPSLVGIGERRTRQEIAQVIRQGAGRMPGYASLGRETIELLTDFLITGKESGTVEADPNWQKYRTDGYNKFLAPDGLPAITPPWGTLNAIDLNKGEIRWKIPFGEIPGSGLKDTGSENYGGPVVTASGVLFIAATNHDNKLRAFDKLTGKLLWETTLPAAGNATPAVYEVAGRQYVVIGCGGGKSGAPSGGSIVAYALK